VAPIEQAVAEALGDPLRLCQRGQHQAAEELIERGEVGGGQRQKDAAVLKQAVGDQRVHKPGAISRSN